MLEVDLGRLQREGRVSVDADLPADHPMWAGLGVRLRGPLAVRLEAQTAGPDVLVRGLLRGQVEVACGRCLTDVVLDFEEPVTVLFRAGLTEVDAEDQEVYPLPEQGLDLSVAVREQFALAVPQYAICRETCRGLCPQCGTNWNEGTCECETAEPDARWGPLRNLNVD